MFGKKKEEAILVQDIQARIEGLDCDDDVEEDAKKIKNIKDLVDIKEKIDKSKNPVDINIVISVAGGLIGTAAIIWHEKLSVITSKALPIVQRMFKI